MTAESQGDNDAFDTPDAADPGDTNVSVFDTVVSSARAEKEAEAVATRNGRRRRWLRLLAICVLAVAVLISGGMFAGWRYLRSVEGQVTRVDAFEGVVEAERPAKPATATKAVNFLILGSDSRNPELGGSRTDTIMVAHVTADHKATQIVSIPRDSWVSIPKASNGRGGTKAKINAAFAWGGVPLMVRTVEALTKIRIDHVVIIDFAGFAQIVDALDGVDITVERAFTSIHPPFRRFKAGPQHLSGEEALDYSRQRKQFADGDFARIQHQQQIIRAILDKATTAGVITDPGSLNAFLTATAKAISADVGLDLLAMANDLRNTSSDQVRYLTNPSRGTGMEGSQSVVYVDSAAAASLYAAVNNDSAGSWQVQG